MDPRILSAQTELLMPFAPRNTKAEEIARLMAEARRLRDEAFTARVTGLFGRLRNALSLRRARRETIEQLSGLTDHELADIGLSRSGIAAAAATAMPRAANDQAEIRTAA